MSTASRLTGNAEGPVVYVEIRQSDRYLRCWVDPLPRSGGSPVCHYLPLAKQARRPSGELANGPRVPSPLVTVIVRDVERSAG